MADSFGDKWTRSHGVTPDKNNVWAASLHGLTGAQVRKGLAIVAESGREFPPSAPVFRQYCIQKTRAEVEQEYKDSMALKSRALENPPDREKGREMAKAMSQSFGSTGFGEKMESAFTEIFGK